MKINNGVLADIALETFKETIAKFHRMHQQLEHAEGAYKDEIIEDLCFLWSVAYHMRKFFFMVSAIDPIEDWINWTEIYIKNGIKGLHEELCSHNESKDSHDDVKEAIERTLKIAQDTLNEAVKHKEWLQSKPN